MQKNILLPFFLFLPFTILSQQSSMFTQAAEEFGLDNPAGLSIEEMQRSGTIANIYVRNQWWDFQNNGYPQTQAVTWLNNSNEQNQYGGFLVSDKIGETRQLGINGKYAHSVLEGLKIGVSAGLYSHRIFTEELDIFDPNDPVAMSAGDTRWRLMAGAGSFYSYFDPNKAWNWYAGAAFQRFSFLNTLPMTEGNSNETNFMAQGGIGQEEWWIGGRFRLSLDRPNAIDLYLRKYFMDEQLFLSGIITSNEEYQTFGGQVGYEWELYSGGSTNNHFLTVAFGFSKPLSKYIQGDNLIFDARATWAWEHD